jgi:Iron-containing redox enzyme
LHLPVPRGPLSDQVIAALRHGTVGRGRELKLRTELRASDPIGDADFQLALWVLYELHYRGFEDVDERREWDPELLRARAELEEVFERALRVATAGLLATVPDDDAAVVEQIRMLIDAAVGPDIPRFVQREATREQFLDLMVQRSIYTLKESDPSSFVLPRLDGPVKVALAELQYDEYGGGRAERLHAALFAKALEGCGLESGYGFYIDQATATTLALNNTSSLLCLHRRLRGAALGHLAAFEATSTLPCRKVASGIQRLGLGEAVWDYFDEHVEADAVHEEVALRSICAAAVAAEPALRADVLFGAAACLAIDVLVAEETMDRWQLEHRAPADPSQKVSA